jgi:hypothetical protein
MVSNRKTGTNVEKLAEQGQAATQADCVLTATRKFVSNLLSSGSHPQEITQSLVYVAVELGLHLDAKEHLLPAVLLSICAASRDFHQSQEEVKPDPLAKELADIAPLTMH